MVQKTPSALTTHQDLIEEGVHPDWVNINPDDYLDPNTEMFVRSMRGYELLISRDVPQAMTKGTSIDEEGLKYLQEVQGHARISYERFPERLDYLEPPSQGRVPAREKLPDSYDPRQETGNSPAIVREHKNWQETRTNLAIYAEGRRPKNK